MLQSCVNYHNTCPSSSTYFESRVLNAVDVLVRHNKHVLVKNSGIVWSRSYYRRKREITDTRRWSLVSSQGETGFRERRSKTGRGWENQAACTRNIFMQLKVVRRACDRSCRINRGSASRDIGMQTHYASSMQCTCDFCERVRRIASRATNRMLRVVHCSLHFARGYAPSIV